MTNTGNHNYCHNALSFCNTSYVDNGYIYSKIIVSDWYLSSCHQALYRTSSPVNHSREIPFDFLLLLFLGESYWRILLSPIPFLSCHTTTLKDYDPPLPWEWSSPSRYFLGGGGGSRHRWNDNDDIRVGEGVAVVIALIANDGWRKRDVKDEDANDQDLVWFSRVVLVDLEIDGWCRGWLLHRKKMKGIF
jgi:hypothetical protein